MKKTILVLAILCGPVLFCTGQRKTYFNFLNGDQDGDYTDQSDPQNFGNTFQVDLTTGYDLTDVFYLGLNATYNTTSYPDGAGFDDKGFYGVALYAQYALSDSFKLGIRPEYFSEFGDFGAIGAVDANGDADVFAITFSGNAVIGPLTFIPELRLDTASEDAFLDNDLNGQKSLSSFLLAAVYSF